MSVESCTAFLEQAQADPQLGELLRAVTDTREVVALGQRSGYRFEAQDLATAASKIAQEGETRPTPESAAPARGDNGIYHYELDLADVPAMAPVLEELPRLTIKPATVDLEQFATAFRGDDLKWTAMSPADPAFQARYELIMAAHWNGAADGGLRRRDFHLVNLDEHVAHPAYDSYLQAKARTIRHLTRIFGCEIRLSGSMWYPPFSYRLWHTNENQPGWRMYLIDFDTEVEDSDTRSFFRYMNPETKDVVTLQDRPKLLRFFKIDQRNDRLFWHCIVNDARRHRWSFGFAIPDDWMTRLQTTGS